MATTNEKMRFTPVGSSFDLPELEHGVLELWERDRSFEALRKKNAGGPRYSFIDGPITANIEAMGVHHAWGRTYKDLYQRYKAMQGFDQRWQNGFDCQGLWVEVQVERELNLNSKRDIETYGIDKFSRACRARVDRSAAAITKQSIRLGQWMDWDNSYYTYSDNNISHIWNALKLVHEKGWLVVGHRAMPWCARCGTALSEHEMTGSYKEMTHASLYVRFPITGTSPWPETPGTGDQRTSFLAWTTTPWTLPANVALAVHPELDYARVRVRADGASAPEVLILSAAVFRNTQWHDAELLETLKGKTLLGLRYSGPFDELPVGALTKPGHRVIAWDEVGEAEGTGIVHIAPGCGAEDFALSKAEKLPVVVPIDETAHFGKGFGWLEGKEARDVAHEIAGDLRKRGRLFRELPYTHSYPVCWRCHEEIVFRVADEWFISMDELRPMLKEAATKVRWLPPHTGDRMQNWLDNMGDWNISRKRYWGLPLPFYNCANSHFFIIGSEKELRERAIRGLEQLTELHRPWLDNVVLACPTCKAESLRVKETGDVWLDAGIVPFSTLNWLDDQDYWRKWFPAEFITENVEQIRLWYYSQLFFSVVLAGRAPYETVLSNEFVYDEQGEEFHKTGENFIDFPQAAERAGSDVIRWYYARHDPAEKVLFGYNVLGDVKRKLLVLWNTYSFFVTYANLDAFDPDEAQVPVGERLLIDRWLLSSLERLVRDCRAALDKYDSQTAALRMEAFWDDLSTWYVRRNRRRFWKAESRRDSLAAYQTMYEALTTLARLFAPFMPFVAESLHQNLVRHAVGGADASVHLSAYPEVRAERIDDDLERRMRAAMRVVSLGRTARSAAKTKVRTPLAKLIAVFDPNDRDRGALEGQDELAAIIRDELNVKEFEVRDDAEGLVRETVKPELKALGPKLGKDLPRVRQALADGRYTSRDGRIEVEGFTLAPTEVLVSHEGTAGHAVGRDAGAIAALVTETTPELEAEGLARELAHHVNNMRKEAGLDIADRITLRYDGPLGQTVERFGDFLAGEVLATTLTPGVTGRGHRWEGELNGVKGILEIERA
ncbi:MAG TPA: isoleucine--tRNA ligase [Candidatus Limnocylindria bacterium]|nr:isoleucine--tRNA ligase [Candidatus Limnocylindria bacterium]